MVDFSICTLLFDDDSDLHLPARCLRTLAEQVGLESSFVKDVRLAINGRSERLKPMAGDFCESLKKQGVPSVLLCNEGVYKYPTMRKLFYNSELQLGSHVMWFDDDSYLTNESRSWFADVAKVAESATVVGQRWFRRLQGNQAEWLREQPWFDNRLPFIKHRGYNSFEFTQGAWWVAEASFLKQHDWPTRELKHCGGDAIFGELCRHTGATVVRYDSGVRINADKAGKNSGAPRRGYTEPMLGVNYSKYATIDFGHHDTKHTWSYF